VHYLGATARAVIREAECPVEVVPPREETRHDKFVKTAAVLVS